MTKLRKPRNEQKKPIMPGEILTQEEKYDRFPKDLDGGLVGQCRFIASFGRCGLRGSVQAGNGSICSYHYVRGNKPGEISFNDFRVWMNEEIRSGSYYWRKHPAEWWWERVIGRARPFSSTVEEIKGSRDFESRRREELAAPGQ